MLLLLAKIPRQLSPHRACAPEKLVLFKVGRVSSLAPRGSPFHFVVGNIVTCSNQSLGIEIYNPFATGRLMSAILPVYAVNYY